ncbi:hypothetical protein [Nocardiopsis sp. YSL2]|uniref:hypothetical protein n=1 Tax=Nocardiopsis sp. YSL2 TaxID=2939492 RepID=UPI0026F43262|nr:hypothetical protein [Nocardiopsis sp. YSL2]
MNTQNLVGHSVLALLTAGLAAAVYLVAVHIAFGAGIAVAALGIAAIALTTQALNSLAGGEQK